MIHTEDLYLPFLVMYDFFLALPFSFVFSLPCFIGVLIAKYRKGRWGWYILGLICSILTYGVAPTIREKYGGYSKTLYIVARMLFSFLFLFFYYHAIRYEIRKREKNMKISDQSGEIKKD